MTMSPSEGGKQATRREKSFPRNIKSLDSVFDFLDECISSHVLSESITFRTKFAVEEVFTNLVKYNAQGPSDITIAFNIDADNLAVQLMDCEAVPFDMTKTEDVNVDLPLAQRKPGGLGIHLVKNMVDRVDYDHFDNKSTITLTMRLGS